MKLTDLTRKITLGLRKLQRKTTAAVSHAEGAASTKLPRLRLPRLSAPLVAVGVLSALGVTLWYHQPAEMVKRGDVGIRSNALTGAIEQFREGTVLVLPGIHTLRTFNLRDQVYSPSQSASASGSAPFQSLEGLSVGVDLSVRYALDASKLASISKDLPDDIDSAIVQPAVQGTVYKLFARYTVREIFSTKRSEIQQMMETELKAKLAADGIVLRGVQMGKVDLPADYRRGMEGLLAEELATEKMRYTLTLKAKQVEESALEADAEKMRRQKAAEATATEQVIAAKAQEETMRHILPFKQKQIEQRQLEAEADKVSRIRLAEGQAQARRIEASGEADSRKQLADAEGYRQEHLGKIASQQMARDGALITKHPLLIQKAMADKLSDKIQVIIAPPSSSGGFIGAALLGGNVGAKPAGQVPAAQNADGSEANEQAGAQ
ncbi:MAG: spfh domain / band 7 family protein [Burkholderiales bacterium PBB4]|nr:MAG: spfh domain / band 7 family protein [Burkholderiales bacterium PBB4]